MALRVCASARKVFVSALKRLISPTTGEDPARCIHKKKKQIFPLKKKFQSNHQRQTEAVCL